MLEKIPNCLYYSSNCLHAIRARLQTLVNYVRNWYCIFIINRNRNGCIDSGSAGSGNFLTRSTWFLIILFFGVCLFLGWYQKNAHEDRSDFSNISEAPAAEQTEVKTDAPVVNTDAPVVEVESATDAPNVD